MSYNYNKTNREHSQALRKNMTPEEKHLWHDFLKYLPCTVNRQKMVGNYILDFYIAEKRLDIELDGSQHRKEEGFEQDQARDQFLNSEKIVVKRYSNQEIRENFDKVKRELMDLLGLDWNDLKIR